MGYGVKAGAWLLPPRPGSFYWQDANPPNRVELRDLPHRWCLWETTASLVLW